MAKKRDKRNETKVQHQRALNRRDFIKTSAAGLGAGAAALSAPSQVQAQTSPGGIQWNYEADVVVVGGGAVGLSAAIRARDLGASVIVIDQNFDVGGKMAHSGGSVTLGGGDAVQMRDAKGESDKEGFITVPPLRKPEELADDPDFLFRDVTDWSVLSPAAQAIYRFNPTDVMRGWADNTRAVRAFLIDNYVRFTRVTGTQSGTGIGRPRQAVAFLMLGDKTDIKAGTVTQADAGVEGESTSHFAPDVQKDASPWVGPNAVQGGACLARCLEFSAREKGVQFILGRHMDEIIREQPFDGRVLGVKASYTPRLGEKGEKLTSLWSNGNIEETADTIYVHAKKGVVIGTGGHSTNVHFRSMFYPRFNDPTHWGDAQALLGPRAQDASGIIAGMRIGANLGGMMLNLMTDRAWYLPLRLATRDPYSAMLPGHPTFFVRGSSGIEVSLASFEHLIAVNQVGKRFFNEINLPKRQNNGGIWPGGQAEGSPTSSMEHVQADWRNCAPGWVKQMYTKHHGLDACLQINEGSTAPHFYSGPVWAIFDQAGVDRAGWNISFPFASETNGCFFKADTIEELADKILKAGSAENGLQKVPLKYLAETVTKWNASVDAGSEPEFERGPDAPMHKIDTAPFYAALIGLTCHDSYGGLKINGKSEVLDMQDQPIPGLYSGGEAAGISVHGLGKGLTQGYIAGSSIMQPA